MSDDAKVMSNANGGLDFDPDALRAKYRAERDKRLRADGNEQYVEVEGRLQPLYRRSLRRSRLHPRAAERRGRRSWSSAAASAACWRARVCARPASTTSASSRRAATSAAPGTGTAIPARNATSRRTSICRCSRRPATSRRRSTPTRRKSSRTARRIGEKFDLYRDACFQTQIKAITWSEDECRWLVTTNRDDAFRARYVVMSNGPLNRPKLPGIPGIDTFKGHTFHTSRWDYGYTGGDTTGNLHKLADKRVAIIGTGATAVQCVPHLAKDAQASVRLPAHALVGRRARQSSDRPRMGQDADARLAEAPDGKFQHPGLRRPSGRGPRQRRLDRHHPQSRRPARRGTRLPPTYRRRRACAHGRNGGLQKDEPDPRARGCRSSRTSARPRR